MLVKKFVKPLTFSKKDQPCWIDKLLLMLSCYVIQYMIHAIVMVDIRKWSKSRVCVCNYTASRIYFRRRILREIYKYLCSIAQLDHHKQLDP